MLDLHGPRGSLGILGIVGKKRVEGTNSAALYAIIACSNKVKSFSPRVILDTLQIQLLHILESK